MQSTDIGAWITTRAVEGASVTAGGGGDGAEVSGQWIDRMGFHSLVFFVLFEATLGDGDTLSLAANLRTATSDAGAGAADYGDAVADAVVATGGSGGSTEYGKIEQPVNLVHEDAERYVQVQFTPTFSAASADTGIFFAGLTLGGADRLPAT